MLTIHRILAQGTKIDITFLEGKLTKHSNFYTTCVFKMLIRSDNIGDLKYIALTQQTHHIFQRKQMAGLSCDKKNFHNMVV